jgi:hypothetical protein
VPEVPIGVDPDDRQECRRQQLLAVHQLRRDLERFAAPRGPRRSHAMAVTDIELVRELEELIAALDRRVPRLERTDESAIARDAAALKAKAVARLAELTGETAPVAATVRTPPRPRR